MGSGTSQHFDHLYLQAFFVTRPYTKTGMFYEIICTSKILLLFCFYQQIYYAINIFMMFFSIFMLLCSAFQSYTDNSQHKITGSDQNEHAGYFMLLTISLNGAIWVSNIPCVSLYCKGMMFNYRIYLNRSPDVYFLLMIFNLVPCLCFT